MDIILESVGIVVLTADTVSLSRVGPYIGSQIGVLDIHTCIQDGNDRTLAALLRHVPQLRQVDSRYTPLLAIEWFGGIGLHIRRRNDRVVGQRHRIDDIVGLRKLHLVQRLQLLDRLVNRLRLLGF